MHGVLCLEERHFSIAHLRNHLVIQRPDLIEKPFSGADYDERTWKAPKMSLNRRVKRGRGDVAVEHRETHPEWAEERGGEATKVGV